MEASQQLKGLQAPGLILQFLVVKRRTQGTGMTEKKDMTKRIKMTIMKKMMDLGFSQM